MDGGLTYGEYAEKFGQFIRGRSFDFVLVEYIELSAVLEYLPDHTITLLDTHDLVAERVTSFRKAGLSYEGIELTVEDELEIFRCYDYVLLIQRNDFESIARWLDKGRLVLVPHAVQVNRAKIREKVRNIGFVASPYPPNVDALRWFMRQVWDSIHGRGELTLNIYGNLKDVFPVPAEFPIRFHGWVADLEQAYRDCDIMINPVRCGAGLKIKNVEALAHGLPLVTTTHGAAGMQDGGTDCFLQADDPAAFAAALNRLIENRAFREMLAQNAFEYARANFSEEKCYGGIVDLIT